MHGMKLIEGEGNTYDSRGKALEGDRFNTVFIVVCTFCLRCKELEVLRHLSYWCLPQHQIASH